MLYGVSFVLLTLLLRIRFCASAAFADFPRYVNTSSVNKPAIGNSSASLHDTVLSSACACNAAKWSWMSMATEVPIHSRSTYTTTSTETSSEINIYTTTMTFATNSTPYTLCDGYPRLDGSTTTSTWMGTTLHLSIDRFLTTQSFTTTGALGHLVSSPTCVIAPNYCSTLSDIWSSAFFAGPSASTSAPNITASHGTAPHSAVLAHSPICGEVSPPIAGPAVANDAVCILPEASVELLYWPVTTNSGHLCRHNATTTTTSPTISGRPNTYVTLNTTLTSPTVYIRLDGRWGYTSAGTTFANQTRIILPYSSTAVSSYCANGNKTYATPLPVDYANFNYPVPADVYRCQPKCFAPSASSYKILSTFTIADMSSTKTLDVLYTTAEIVWASSAYPIVNLCSTIWDDYAPALMVPADLLSVNLVTELGGGGFCTFSVNEANVFFDPPKALSQMTAAAGPSSPLLPATTTMQTPSITAEPAGSVSAPSVTITGVGVSDTVTSAGADPQTSSKAVESTSYPAQDTSSVSIVDPTVATPAASARSSSAVESASGASQGMGSEQLPAPTQADPSTPTEDSPYLSEVISEDSTTTPPGTDGAAYESTTASSTFTTMISSEDPGSSPQTTAIAPILTSPDVAPAGSAAAQPPPSTDGIAGATASILAIPPPSSTPTTPTPVTVYTSSDDTSTPQSSTQSSAAILVDPAGPIISVLAGLGSSLSIKPVTVSAGMEIASTTATSPSTPPLPAIVWTASNGREYTLPTIPSENSPMSSGALATPIGMAGQASTTGATTYDSTSMTETEDPVPPPSSRTTNPVGGLGNIVAALSSIAASEATPTNSALTALQTETSGTLSSSQSRGGGEMPTAAGSPGNSFLPSFVPSGSAITKSGLTRPLASSESHALTDGASRASSTGTDAGGAVASGTGTSGTGVGGSAGGSGVPSAGCRGGGSGWWMALVGLSVLLYWY